MNLKNKTDKELWDMLADIYGWKNTKLSIEIQKEIIRREKDNENK